MNLFGEINRPSIKVFGVPIPTPANGTDECMIISRHGKEHDVVNIRIVCEDGSYIDEPINVAVLRKTQDEFITELKKHQIKLYGNKH